MVGIIILLVVGLCGCNENFSNDKNKFIGVWEGISYLENDTFNVILEFFEDNTMKQVTDEIHTHWFNFETDDSYLYLTLQEFPDFIPLIYNYKFSNNDNSLTLSNESLDTLILTKQ